MKIIELKNTEEYRNWLSQQTGSTKIINVARGNDGSYAVTFKPTISKRGWVAVAVAVLFIAYVIYAIVDAATYQDRQQRYKQEYKKELRQLEREYR
jgi:hypothetical protein